MAFPLEETSILVSLAEALDAAGYVARARGRGAEDSGGAARTAGAERCRVGYQLGMKLCEFNHCLPTPQERVHPNEKIGFVTPKLYIYIYNICIYIQFACQGVEICLFSGISFPLG